MAEILTQPSPLSDNETHFILCENCGGDADTCNRPDCERIDDHSDGRSCDDCREG